MELILVARVLDFDEETYIIVEDRDEPICPYCDGRLEPEGDDDDDVVSEWWYCEFCMESHEFYIGMYGTIEHKVTREEWEIHEQQERERRLLEAKYGVDNPSSIRDYWQLKNVR